LNQVVVVQVVFVYRFSFPTIIADFDFSAFGHEDILGIGWKGDDAINLAVRSKTSSFVAAEVTRLKFPCNNHSEPPHVGCYLFNGLLGLISRYNSIR
jgi:hypothetical protein